MLNVKIINNKKKFENDYNSNNNIKTIEKAKNYKCLGSWCFHHDYNSILMFMHHSRYLTTNII